MTTEYQYDQVISVCRGVFVKKLTDYGAAWRIMRQESVTDTTRVFGYYRYKRRGGDRMVRPFRG